MTFFTLGEPCDEVADRQHAEADPDRERIERTRVDVVAFARFARRGVEIEHQRDARHDEEPKDDREVAFVAVQLVDQSDQSQQEGQEIVGVAALVFGDFAGQVVLRAEEFLVDPFDARQPVAVGDLRACGLYVALASHEIPEEVTPVHVRQLVVEEEVEVLGERRLDDRAVLVTVVVEFLAAEIDYLAPYGTALFVAEDFTLVVAHDVGPGAVGAPLLVLLLAFAGIPHAGEEVYEFGGVGVTRDDRSGFVFAVLVEVVERFFLVAFGRCGVIGAQQQRTVAVLVAVEHRQQCVRVVGVVAVHRRIGRGADRHRRVRREADEHHRRREQDDVPDDLAFAVGVPCGPAAAQNQRQREEHDARIDGQAERIDEKEIDHRPDIDRVGDDDVVDEEQDGARDQRGVDHAFEGHLLRLTEIVDEYQRRNGQQVEDVHADRKAHHVGDQHDPARRMGFVGLLFPFEHQPHHERREHRREGVYLALDGREPERVGEGVGQRADDACAEDGQRVGLRQLTATASHQTPCQMGDGPEQEQDAERAGDGVHGVYGHSHVVGIAEGEQGRQPGQHHEQRCTGRVSDFEFVGSCNEFRAVPEARNGFHRHQVDRGGDGEDRPADDVVPAFEECHIVFGMFALFRAKVII